MMIAKMISRMSVPMPMYTAISSSSWTRSSSPVIYPGRTRATPFRAAGVGGCRTLAPGPLHGSRRRAPAYAHHVPSATISLPGDPGSVPTARRHQRHAARAQRLHDQVSVDDGRVRLEVEDGSPVTLQARQYSTTATTGRGLHIVESLSLEWGSTPRDGGKSVWALLPVEDARGDGTRRGAA
jgi:hypothetical protein